MIIKLYKMKKIFFLLFTFCALNASAQKNLTPEMLWKLGRVSGETITPNQKNVIYGVSYYNQESNKAERNLYTIPLTGGISKQITKATGGESVLTMDTKSAIITYTYKGQLWTMNADGTNPKQLTTYSDGLENVRISPDGKHILFTKDVSIIKNIANEKYPD